MHGLHPARPRLVFRGTATDPRVDPNPLSVVQKFTSDKKPVSQLTAVPEWNALLAFSGSHVLLRCCFEQCTAH